MVEQKPSKLTTRVRFPSPAPAFGGLQFGFTRPCGSVVEHSLGKGEVTRSIRVMGTTNSPGESAVICPFGQARIRVAGGRWLGGLGLRRMPQAFEAVPSEEGGLGRVGSKQ